MKISPSRENGDYVVDTTELLNEYLGGIAPGWGYASGMDDSLLPQMAIKKMSNDFHRR